MKIAALYDIHGNLPALDAVLKELKEINVDNIIIGGDVVLGPMSKECLDKLTQLNKPIEFILGNCETAIINSKGNKTLDKLPESVIEDINWTAQQLTNEQIDFIKTWPKLLTEEIDGIGKVLFCHATPKNENETFTKLTDEKKLNSIFKNINADLVVCGHTHMQFDITVGDRRIINAGSVGMPFGKPGAYWLLIDDEIKLRKTEYDLDKAAYLIKGTKYPNAKNFAEQNVLNPPKEETMLKAFSDN